MYSTSLPVCRPVSTVVALHNKIVLDRVTVMSCRCAHDQLCHCQVHLTARTDVEDDYFTHCLCEEIPLSVLATVILLFLFHLHYLFAKEQYDKSVKIAVK